MATYIQTDKLNALIHSRKFWALVTGLLVDAFAAIDKVETVEVAVMAAVATLSAYMIATAHEDNGASVIQAAAITAASQKTAP